MEKSQLLVTAAKVSITDTADLVILAVIIEIGRLEILGKCFRDRNAMAILINDYLIMFGTQRIDELDDSFTGTVELAGKLRN